MKNKETGYWYKTDKSYFGNIARVEESSVGFIAYNEEGNPELLKHLTSRIAVLVSTTKEFQYLKALYGDDIEIIATTIPNYRLLIEMCKKHEYLILTFKQYTRSKEAKPPKTQPLIFKGMSDGKYCNITIETNSNINDIHTIRKAAKEIVTTVLKAEPLPDCNKCVNAFNLNALFTVCQERLSEATEGCVHYKPLI